MDRQTNRQIDGWTDGQPVFDSATLRYNPCIYSSGIQLYFHTRNSTDFTVLKQFTKTIHVVLDPVSLALCCAFQAPR